MDFHRAPDASPCGRDSTVRQNPPGGLLSLGLIAPLAGLGAGLIGALFRLTLEDADHFRNIAVAWMASWGAGSFLLVVAFASIAAAVAAWLVRRVAPSAAGSGIPRVMAVLDDASGTPGGILVPLLALGAELGLWVGKSCTLALPGTAMEPQAFAIVGMAALFTAIVRAPLTSIVLVTEMVADTTMLLPMIVACSVAMLLPALLGDKSILDSLKGRLLARNSGIPPDKVGPRVANGSWSAFHDVF